jgi:hypothetical protein
MILQIPISRAARASIRHGEINLEINGNDKSTPSNPLRLLL